MPTVRFADGVVSEFPQAARVVDVIPETIKTGPRKKRPIAALLNGQAVGLDAPLPRLARRRSTGSRQVIRGPCP